ncbi:MAG TPA: ABC transporter substrate-binding protein [Verrucomicrobiae bacterium]
MLQPKVLFGVMAAAALVFGGCGKKSESGNNASSGSGSGGAATAGDKLAKDDGFPLPEPALLSDCEPGIRGGRLIVATVGDPKTFNPITENEQSSTDIIRLLYVGVMGFDWRTQKAVPGMAESCTAAEDQKTWTIVLRKNLKWSDGKPLTADDVVFTWNDIIFNPKINNVTRDMFMMHGKPFVVTKVDDLTVKIVTPEVYPPFLEFAAGGVPILPKHKLEEFTKPDKDGNVKFESALGINTPAKDLVCSGPYKLKDFKPGQLVLLERNPYFPNTDSKGQRLPYLDEVVYMSTPDMNAMSLRMLAGETHVHEFVRPDEYNRFKEAADKGKFKLLELGIGPEKSFIWFNLNTGSNTNSGKPYVAPHKLKWFRDTKFRQAIAHAIDRDSIVKGAFSGRGEVHFGFVSPVIKKWHNPNTAKYPYDIPKAKALLKEIGFEDRNNDGILEDRDGKVLEFEMNTNAGNNLRERISVLVQEDLKRLGCKVNYRPIDFNALVDKIQNSYDYECMYLGLGGGASDPIANSNVVKSDGFTHFWFPRQSKPSFEWEAKLDELMNTQGTTLDEAKRKEAFDEVQVILAREAPFIYLANQYNYTAVDSKLAGLKPTVLSSYRVTWNVEELYFQKK